MKHLKTLVLAKSIAAALIATAGIAAPAISHASPDDGMVCRSGYNAQFAGGDMKCTKVLPAQATTVKCDDRILTKLVERANNPTVFGADGKDVCVNPNGSIGITSNGSLAGLTKGTDFVFAVVRPSDVTAIRIAAERREESSLGLLDADVDAHSTVAPVVVDAGTGSHDQALVTVTLFTFPVPALSLIQPIQPILPNLSSTFLPK